MILDLIFFQDKILKYKIKILKWHALIERRYYFQGIPISYNLFLIITYSSVISGNARYNEHEVESDDELNHECLEIRPLRWRSGEDVVGSAKQKTKCSSCHSWSKNLSWYISWNLYWKESNQIKTIGSSTYISIAEHCSDLFERESFAGSKSNGDCRIEMSTGDMTHWINQHHDGQSPNYGNPSQWYNFLIVYIHHHWCTTSKYQEICAQHLSHQLQISNIIIIHNYMGLRLPRT